MKKVLLGEGPNDLLFFTALHRIYADHLSYDTFDNEYEETTETKRLTQHDVGGTFEYLYKCEGGRSKLIQIFSDISVMVVNADMEMSILVDLDGDSTEDLYNQIDRYLTGDYGNQVSLVEQSRETNEHLCILECDLNIESISNESVNIFAFHQDLESVMGIQEREDRSSKRKKIQRYIENNYSITQNIANKIY